MTEKNLNQQLEKGIKINAGFRQIVVAAFIVFVMLILPIYVSENYDVNDVQNMFKNNPNPYSAESLQERDGGQVAGVSTSGVSSQNSTLSLPIIGTKLDLSQANTDNKPLFIASIVFFSASFFIFLYLVLGKFETA